MLIATSGRGYRVRRPSKPTIATMLADLRRGSAHMVLEPVEDEQPGSWYVQVLLRDNNTYQLEYRDGVAEQHYRTQTISQEKVLGAMLGWAGGKPGWRDGFMWNNLADEFAGDAQAASDDAR